jgi:TetR/AcrR family tetracycline transcriptional repressor
VTAGSARGAGRPERPVRPALTRAYIVSSALALIDRDGLDGFSMRKLGTELGVDPMAVYHHVPSKSALFDGVVDAVYSGVDLAGVPRTGDWREQTAEFMHRMRAAIRRHPNALPILATRPEFGPAMLDIGELALGILHDAGFTTQQAFDILNCLATFTIGHALAEVGVPVGGETAAPDEMLAAIDPRAYPRLHRALTDGYDYRPDDQYEMGLRALLDGFQALLAAARGAA